jgi:hypothetical protein
MEIVPFVSVGTLLFGDTRKKTREKLGDSYTTFRKVEGAPLTDSYDDLGLHLYYDKKGHLEFVEAFEPDLLTFRGLTFVEKPLRGVLTKMEKLGFTHTETDAGFVFFDSGIVFGGERNKVDSVAAFRKGYYV